MFNQCTCLLQRPDIIVVSKHLGEISLFLFVIEHIQGVYCAPSTNLYKKMFKLSIL